MSLTYWILDGETSKEVDAIESIDDLPEGAFVWIACAREEDPDWHEAIERLFGVDILEEHRNDSLNNLHPPFHDGTTAYDIVIVRELDDRPEQLFDLATRQVTFLLFERGVVMIRSKEAERSSQRIKKIKKDAGRIPRRPVGLLHRLLNEVIDDYLSLREPLSDQLDVWQRRLLDPRDPFNAWESLLEHRNKLRRLGVNCERTGDAIIQWRDRSAVDFGEDIVVRFNDLLEHLRRVEDLAAGLSAQIESLVQIHFSATAHRTNEIMKVLTVVASVFMPLTFIAGIYGMNFENMPELGWRYSYFVLVGVLLVVGGSLMLAFRKRGWI